MSVYEQIAELTAARDKANAQFEAQISALKAQGAAELEAARAKLAAMEAVMGVVMPPVVREPVAPRAKPIDPVSETDFGMGVTGGGGNGNATLEEFQDELASMRERSANRPARQARR